MTDGRRLWVRRRIVVLVSVYAVIFGLSAVGGTFDLEPPVPIRPAFLGGLMLGVGGAAAGLWLWLVGGGRGAAAAGLVAVAAYAVEGVGHATGLPFGAYRYSGALTPALPGGVPLAIVAAWLLVTVGALGAARALLPAGAGRAPRAAAGGGLVLALDLQIEPAAALIQGYWVWLEGGPYYGVPTQNFVAWLVTGLALCALTVALTEPVGRPAPDPALAWVPLVLYALVTLLFALLNLSHGYPLAGAVGAAVLGALVFRMRQRARLARRSGRAVTP